MEKQRKGMDNFSGEFLNQTLVNQRTECLYSWITFLVAGLYSRGDLCYKISTGAWLSENAGAG
jgi:hypothetical protein